LSKNNPRSGAFSKSEYPVQLYQKSQFGIHSHPMHPKRENTTFLVEMIEWSEHSKFNLLFA